ncbi:MAG: hypothetical protein QW087_05375 [Methanomassiliicoccales archaeon]
MKLGLKNYQKRKRAIPHDQLMSATIAVAAAGAGGAAVEAILGRFLVR